MAEELKRSVNQLMHKVPGLYCILVSDRDGVPVLKVTQDKTPEAAIRPGFISTFGLAVDQGGKLGLGKTKTVICSFLQYQVIQMNKAPLVITFIASDTCNTGHVLALESQIDPILENLALAVADT